MNRIAANSESRINSYNLRIFLLLAFFTGFILLVIFRLFHLQIISHERYTALAASQHDGINTITPERGEIYLSPFAQGTPLLVATNVTRALIYANPKLVEDKAGTAAALAGLLEMDKAYLTQALSSDKSYEVLKKNVDEKIGRQIADLDLTGIYIEETTERFYPEKSLASQVLGFLGFKGDRRVGQYGVEGQFEAELAGRAGELGAQRDAAGRLLALAGSDFSAAQDGDDVYLTIDPAIQHKAEEVLEQTVTEHGADSGSVVIVNPQSGAVLAMANFPDYDPNTYNKVENLSVFTNKALTGAYEPGSIMKPLTMSAALNENKITPETTYEDTGLLEIDDQKIRNSDNQAHGIQTMKDVLTKSLNTGTVWVQQQIGNKKFKEYVERFGFGKKTDLELAGEVDGNLDNLDRRGDVFFATASYGQGITATPIQMIRAYTAVANGGKMVEPYIISKIVHPDGTVVELPRSSAKEVISVKAASTVSAMMVDVIENGHGKRAGVAGYYLAGKTGTAQVPYENRAGYDPSKSIGSFVGFGPVDDPKFLMLVRVDNPKDVKFAESTAAPAFGRIAAFILNYLEISPTRQ